MPEASYLDRLKFDSRLLAGWVAGYLRNFRIVILLMVSIIIAGAFSYLELPKRLNPEVEIPIVTVVTVMPGASPEDVERLITIPIENKIKNAQGLDEYVSVSNDSVSVITLQFFSEVARDKAKDDTQSLVDQVTDLPTDAETPSVKALDFEDQPIWTFALSGSTDTPSLMIFAEHLKKQIEQNSMVDRVVLNGFEEQEILVEVEPEVMNRYRLNPIILSQAISKSASAFPAGEVSTDKNSFSLTLNPVIETVDDIRNVRLSIGGQVVTLNEIATVSERAVPKQATTWLASPDHDAQRAVTFYVYKTSSSSIDKAGQAVETVVTEFLADRGNQFAITTIENTSHEIDEQFTELLGEFRTTILLVFGCLLLFLGLRQAVISSFTVPLTFLSAFVFMRFLGMSINFLSLFAFLLTLGLLVDDTIVTVSAMTTYYKTNKFTPLQTGLLVWRDTIVPIWSTTITTIWSFVPLLLSTGIIGEFIKPIPVVVTVTMISSTAIAVLITLPIMMTVLKPQIPGRIVLLLKLVGLLGVAAVLVMAFQGNPLLPLIVVLFFAWLGVISLVGGTLYRRLLSQVSRLPHSTTVLNGWSRLVNTGLIDIEHFAQAYYRLIWRTLSSSASRWKVIIAIIIYAVISFALLPLGLVKNEFFPKTDTETIYINVTLPAGTTLQQTQAAGVELLNQLRTTHEVIYSVVEVGKRFDENGGRANSSNGFLVSLRLPPEEEREISSIDLAQELRESLKSYPAGEVSVVEVSGGPPAGADVQISLLGDDLTKLEKIAQQVEQYLEAQPGLTNVDVSIKEGMSQLVFVPQQAKVAESGLSNDQISLWLRMYASGWPLDEITFGQDEDATDVTLRVAGEIDPSRVGTILVANQQGMSYPLLSLGQLVPQANPSQIVREGGKRRVTISAATIAGYSATEQNQALLEHVEGIELPDGYSWKTGGVNEENQKSVNSILQAMVVSAVLILVTMVVQFRSFRQAFIVLIVIPLAVSSVFLIFALTGTPLSFPALIGVLSLFGIVVTNSMFIVDKINLNQREGMNLKEAIADAGASRLEPIILTKLCTVFGLLPITITDPLWRGLGGAIISGLLLSSTIMLLFIPVVYYNVYAGRDDKRNDGQK